MYNTYQMLSNYTLSCSILPLSFQFSIWTKNPQNLLVSFWIINHRLLIESFEQSNFLSLWKVDQILSQNVVRFLSVEVTISKLILSYVNTSLMSLSMVNLFPCGHFLLVYFISMGVQIVPFQLGVEIDGHLCLNVEWPSKYYCQNLVPCHVRCQGRRDFAESIT